MKFLNTLLAAIVLSLSMNAMAAVSDDDAIEYVEAITSGNMKIVKKYVEADAANANYKSFAWSPVQMAASMSGGMTSVPARARHKAALSTTELPSAKKWRSGATGHPPRGAILPATSPPPAH